jgi:hypothetical protein
MRIAIPIAAVLVAGCGSVVDRGRSATPPYDGPLDPGAPVRALECDGTTPYRRGEGVYDDGLAKVQGSAEAALDNYMSESGLSFFAPSDGYAVEREKDGRVLFSYDVDGRTTVSMSPPTASATGTATKAGVSGPGRSAIRLSCPRRSPTTSTSGCGRTSRGGACP